MDHNLLNEGHSSVIFTNISRSFKIFICKKLWNFHAEKYFTKHTNKIENQSPESSGCISLLSMVQHEALIDGKWIIHYYVHGESHSEACTCMNEKDYIEPKLTSYLTESLCRILIYTWVKVCNWLMLWLGSRYLKYGLIWDGLVGWLWGIDGVDLLSSIACEHLHLHHHCLVSKPNQSYQVGSAADTPYNHMIYINDVLTKTWHAS